MRADGDGSEPRRPDGQDAGRPDDPADSGDSYTGPKKRIAVLAFGDKSAKGYARIGDGMADMLTTELFNTNRFDIIERRELKGIIDEQDFGATGRVKRETAAPIGQIEGAEYLVRGDVTAFEPDRLTIGGAALGLITLGATAVISAKNRTPIGMVTYKEAYLAMDIRIIDARTGRIVNATAVEGKAHDVGGFIAGTVGGERRGCRWLSAASRGRRWNRRSGSLSRRPLSTSPSRSSRSSV